MIQEPFTLTDPLSVGKAAAYLGLSRWTVYYQIKRGALRAFRMGGIILIPTPELDRFLDQRNNRAT